MVGFVTKRASSLRTIFLHLAASLLVVSRSAGAKAVPSQAADSPITRFAFRRKLTDVEIARPASRNYFADSARVREGVAVPASSSMPTVVTAYFEMESKHSRDKYVKWMTNFFSTADSLVIFVTPSLAPWISTLRNSSDTRIVPFDIKRLTVTRRFPARVWTHQLQIDPERILHKSVDLLQIWLAKTELVMRAIALDPFKSTIFAWSDVGCWRGHHKLKRWLTYPQRTPRNAVALSQLYDPRSLRLTKYELYVKGTHHRRMTPIAGAQMVADKAVWADWSAAFYNIVDEYVKAGIFVGEDQAVMTTACVRHPSLCAFESYGWFGLQTHFGATYMPQGSNQTSVEQ